MLNFLEWGLDFHDDTKFIKHVPEDLEFAVKVLVFGGL
jgi:hypothetical protein